MLGAPGHHTHRSVEFDRDEVMLLDGGHEGVGVQRQHLTGREARRARGGRERARERRGEQHLCAHVSSRVRVPREGGGARGAPHGGDGCCARDHAAWGRGGVPRWAVSTPIEAKTRAGRRGVWGQRELPCFLDRLA